MQHSKIKTWVIKDQTTFEGCLDTFKKQVPHLLQQSIFNLTITITLSDPSSFSTATIKIQERGMIFVKEDVKGKILDSFAHTLFFQQNLSQKLEEVSSVMQDRCKLTKNDKLIQFRIDIQI